MATLEQVERLREKTNVSFSEAKAALEACNDDLLDAIIYLEEQGKVKDEGGFYSSAESEQSKSSAGGGCGEPGKAKSSFSDLVNRCVQFCKKLFHKGNTNLFEVFKNDETIFSIPVSVLVLLLIVAFWFIIPMAILGLFFGYRYRFSGPDLGKKAVNEPMNTIADAAQSLRDNIVNH